MKNKLRNTVLATLAVVSTSVLAVPKTAVIDAAGELAGAIEELDTRLHALKGPEDIIELTHHTEQTVLDLIDILMEPEVD